MTAPAAASQRADGSRVYRIPDPATGELLELPNITGVVPAPKHITDWQQKMVLLGAALREDIAVRVAAAHLLPAGAGRNAELARIARDAIDAGQVAEKGHLPSDRGTAYHSLTERLDELVAGDVARVDELGLPRPVAEIARAYIDAMTDIDIVRSETTVVSFANRYAGTTDRIIRFRNRRAVYGDAWERHSLATGSFIVDAKFGRLERSVGLQLAAAAGAEWIWDAETQILEALPDDLRRDVGFAFHPDRGLVVVDLAGAHDAFCAAVRLRAWQETDPLGGSLAAPRTDPDPFAGLPDEHGKPRPAQPASNLGPKPDSLAAKRAWLLERVAAIAARPGGLDVLAVHWPADVPTFKHAPAHSADQLAAIETAIDETDKILAVPFPQPDPTDPHQTYVAPDDPRRRALIERAELLPPDLARAARAALADRHLPKLTRGLVSEADLDAIDETLTPFETRAGERARCIDDAITVTAEHGVSTTAICAALGVTDPAACLDGHLVLLDNLADAVGLGVIVERGGRLVVDRPTDILARHGGPRGVLDVGRRTARALGLEPPRSSDDALADVLLAAALACA